MPRTFRRRKSLKDYETHHAPGLADKIADARKLSKNSTKEMKGLPPVNVGLVACSVS